MNVYMPLFFLQKCEILKYHDMGLPLGGCLPTVIKAEQMDRLDDFSEGRDWR